MRRVNSREYFEVIKAVKAEFDRKHETDFSTCHDIEIYEMDSFGPDTESVFGVNWAALGTVSADEACHFGYRLTLAAELADELTALHLVRVYGKEV